MTNHHPQQPDQPGQPGGRPPSSTSIDDLLPGPDIAAPAPTTAATTTSRWKNAKGKHNLANDAPMLFFFGLLMLLWGSIMVFDRYGPSTQLDGRVTDLDVSRSRRSTTYSIEGVDERGGRFDTDVRKSVYDRADRGDRVTVTRAWLTGRVTAIDGGSWRHETETWKVALFSAVAGGGLVLVVISVRAMRRKAAAEPEGRGWARRIRWPIAISLVAAVGWVAYERNQAAGDGQGSSGVAVLDEQSDPALLVTVPTTQRDCIAASGDNQLMINEYLTSATTIGEFTSENFTVLLGLAKFNDPDCTHESMQQIVCESVRKAMAANPEFVVSTDGRCPGL